MLLADLFHMNIEEADIAAAIRAGAATSATSISSIRTAAPPAPGTSTYPPIVAALRAIGYRGFASAEAFPYPDPDEAARRTIDAFRRYFPAS